MGALWARMRRDRRTTSTGGMERRESKAIILHPRLAKPEPEAQPGPPAKPRNVGDVPDGVLRLVAAKVDCARSLAAFAATCQRFRAVVEDAMWEELCLRDFPTPRGEGQAAPESWEALVSAAARARARARRTRLTDAPAAVPVQPAVVAGGLAVRDAAGDARRRVPEVARRVRHLHAGLIGSGGCRG